MGNDYYKFLNEINKRQALVSGTVFNVYATCLSDANNC